MGLELPDGTSPAEQARSLMARKDEIEAAIDAHGTILRVNGADMQTPLVDREGFPRADMDVWAVRTARVRIIELRNDLKDVRDRLGKALEGVYARSATSSADANGAVEESAKLVPFAKVNSVAPGSPAAEAGMQRDDVVLKFGHLTSTAFASSLQPLAELVSVSENKPIAVIVRRAQSLFALRLTPRQGWGGRGMLGCHLLPHTGS